MFGEEKGKVKVVWKHEREQGRPWGMGDGATAQGPGKEGAHDGVYTYTIAQQKASKKLQKN